MILGHRAQNRSASLVLQKEMDTVMGKMPHFLRTQQAMPYDANVQQRYVCFYDLLQEQLLRLFALSDMLLSFRKRAICQLHQTDMGRLQDIHCQGSAWIPLGKVMLGSVVLLPSLGADFREGDATNYFSVKTWVFQWKGGEAFSE